MADVPEQQQPPALDTTAIITSFYSDYVRLAHDGVVFNLDLSERTDLGASRSDEGEDINLTDDEVRERTEWLRLKDDIADNYENRIHTVPKQLSREEFLHLRVIAPCLSDNPAGVSARSVRSEFRANRHYPKTIVPWSEFPALVNGFRVVENTQPAAPVDRGAVRQVLVSILDKSLLGNERREEGYLFDKALQPLYQAGLIGVLQESSRGCVGEMDFSVMHVESTGVAIVGESKSTHNLPLPMAAQDLTVMYNSARAAVDALPEPDENEDRSSSRPLGWSHVGHPLSQVLGYMVLNECRYGVLTSGSRTYFVHIKHMNGEETVVISDAWFIGQRNYLRAWAFFYSSSSSDSQPEIDKEFVSKLWLKGTPEKAKAKKKDNIRSEKKRGGSAKKRPRRNPPSSQAKSVQSMIGIPTVSFGDFELGQPIGYGRRGSVFSATWEGETVAVKMFDTHKNKGREAFEHELKAYKHLKEAWGILIPTPKFTAEAFGVIFLGMQMAEHPSQGARTADWDETEMELEERYGFRHLDLEGYGRGPGLQNRMVLRDESGSELRILIDLEQSEWDQE